MLASTATDEVDRRGISVFRHLVPHGTGPDTGGWCDPDVLRFCVLTGVLPGVEDGRDLSSRFCSAIVSLAKRCNRRSEGPEATFERVFLPLDWG